MLVSASWTVRYAARSTASGQGRPPALTSVAAARPLSSISRPRSASRGCGAGGTSVRTRDVRSTPTIWRSSSRVRTDSSRMVRAVATAAGSLLLTWSAPAWMLIRLTWWETTSCISRASRPRSVIRTRSASSRLSRSWPRVSSSSRAASSRLVRESRPRAAGPAASITHWMAYSALSRSSARGWSLSGQWKNSTRAKTVAQSTLTHVRDQRAAAEYTAVTGAIQM